MTIPRRTLREIISSQIKQIMNESYGDEFGGKQEFRAKVFVAIEHPEFQQYNDGQGRLINIPVEVFEDYDISPMDWAMATEREWEDDILSWYLKMDDTVSIYPG